MPGKLFLIPVYRFLLISAVLLFFSQNVWAMVPAAQVIWTKGSVAATLPTQPERLLHRRSPLYEHDVIATKADSSAEIIFTDGAIVSLRPETTFKIDEYRFKPGGNAASNKSVVSVITGGFRTITGIIPKAYPENYQANSPVGTIGVRGTDYSVYYNPKEGGLAVKLTKGKIEVKNKKGSLVLDISTGQTFGEIADENSGPVAVANQPAIFSNDALITSSAIQESKNLQDTGDSKTVSSFCIS